MSSDEVAATGKGKKPACKICCACPAERQARDECTLLKGVEACQKEIGAFYKCLLHEGFSEEEVGRLRGSVRSF
ncbi:cytochrome c oxidase copper chaperone [Trypanosoma brucei equiperdum]|uniref:Cytochrome c oxidase copper chaperone n=1 Tax=Trypanosoma brucei equiperdum TaxID=630700 RepID=A0A3L6LH12_9TRYP|nr:cytochrome c oxidase copper chaperone [Trypanosoma brucei equiperdum]